MQPKKIKIGGYCFGAALEIGVRTPLIGQVRVPVASTYRSMHHLPSGYLRQSTTYVPRCENGSPPLLGVIRDSNTVRSIAQSPVTRRLMSVIENSYVK
jgi:hypothetical protein